MNVTEYRYAYDEGWVKHAVKKSNEKKECEHVCSMKHPHIGYHKCQICGAEYGIKVRQ